MRKVSNSQLLLREDEKTMAMFRLPGGTARDGLKNLSNDGEMRFVGESSSTQMKFKIAALAQWQSNTFVK